MCLGPRDTVAFESAGQKHHVTSPRRRRHAVVDDEPHVSFRDESENEVHLVSTTLSCLESPQERHQLWYNREDIKQFRREAQCLSKRLREDPETCVDEYTRGLELRTSLHRQDRKQVIVRQILEAQEEDSSPEELAQIAQQYSVWSRKLAQAQGHKDYYAAYHPGLTSVLPEMPAMLDCSRDVALLRNSSSHKRTLLGTSLEQTGRRVRCRMF